MMATRDKKNNKGLTLLYFRCSLFICDRCQVAQLQFIKNWKAEILEVLIMSSLFICVEVLISNNSYF